MHKGLHWTHWICSQWWKNTSPGPLPTHRMERRLIDISANGMWGGMFENTCIPWYDCFQPQCSIKKTKHSQPVYKKHEQDKQPGVWACLQRGTLLFNLTCPCSDRRFRNGSRLRLKNSGLYVITEMGLSLHAAPLYVGYNAICMAFSILSIQAIIRTLLFGSWFRNTPKKNRN